MGDTADEGERPVLTQPGGTSSLQYAWVILFVNDINESEPFFIVPLNEFANSDFPFSSIEGEMKPEDRIKVWTFECFPGKQFRVFAKIQMGMLFYHLKTNNRITFYPIRYILFI